MTKIGDIIEQGEPIPDDVTEMSDRDTGSTGWGRWVRTAFGDWEWSMTPDEREEAQNNGGGGNSTMVMQRGRRLAPYRVLAVREPEKRLALHLPEVPDELRGAGALIGNSTGDRYVWQPGGVWKTVNSPTAGWEGCLGHILEREGGTVTVEMPKPRTVLDEVADLRAKIIEYHTPPNIIGVAMLELLDRIVVHLKTAEDAQ